MTRIYIVRHLIASAHTFMYIGAPEQLAKSISRCSSLRHRKTLSSHESTHSPEDRVISNLVMIDPDLDRELTLANEFVLEALKAESSDQMEFSLSSQSSKPSCSAGLESSYGLCLENDFAGFFQTNNDDQSLSTLDPMSDQLDKKGADQRSYHLVPDICLNQNGGICCESKRSDPFSHWGINSGFFPRQTVGCLIKSETTTQCYVSLPNIIDSMNRIDLIDSIPLNIKEEPMEEDEIRVDFLNLKDVYIKPEQYSDRIEDSFLYVFVKTDCKVSGVKVYLKQFYDGVPGQCAQGLICLPSEYNRRRGFLSVDLNCLSLCLPSRADYIDDISSFWQLIVKVQLEDGRSLCHFSKSFNIRRDIEGYENEKEFKTKLSQFAISPMDSNSNDFSSSVYSLKKQEFSESKQKSCALEDIRTSKFPVPYQKSLLPDDDTTSDVISYGTKNIVLAPGSTLDVSMISSKLQDETDVVSIQEQTNFAGLLKVMKRNQLQDTSRRKANGYRSAEEAFVWACGHCFFSRGKKSTVKSHVSRQVCQKRRRLLSDCITKDEKKVKPKVRRCHTFNGIRSKPMRNYELKRCRTP